MVRKQLRRDQVAVFFANLPACLVGMEACGSAHHWARKLQGFGHQVRLISPQFVKPYVKSNKNDAADAEAICEAVARPNMRFVPIKTVEQQAVLSVHRVRQGFVKARTAQANQIRGLLTEFGLVLPQGITNVFRRVPQLIDEAADLPASMRQLIERLLENMKVLDRQVKELEAQIKAWHLGSELSRELERGRADRVFAHRGAFRASFGWREACFDAPVDVRNHVLPPRIPRFALASPRGPPATPCRTRHHRPTRRARR